MDGLRKLKSPILLTEIMLTQHSYWQTFTSSFFRLVLNMRLINLHLSLSLSSYLLQLLRQFWWTTFRMTSQSSLYCMSKNLEQTVSSFGSHCRIHHLCHKQSESLAPVRLAHKRKLKKCLCLLPNHIPWTIYQTQDHEISYTWFPPNCWTSACMCALLHKCCC